MSARHVTDELLQILGRAGVGRLEAWLAGELLTRAVDAARNGQAAPDPTPIHELRDALRSARSGTTRAGTVPLSRAIGGELVTIVEIERRIGVARSTVYRWTRAGRVSSGHDRVGRLLVSIDDVRRLHDERSAP